MNGAVERSMMCRAYKPIEFTWNRQNTVTVRRADLNMIMVDDFGISPDFFTHRFHCSDCIFVFGCTVLNPLSQMKRFEALQSGGVTWYRQVGFQNLTLEQDIYSPPRIK